MAISTYLATRLLDWITNTTAMPSMPTVLGVSLHTANPGPTGTTGSAMAALTGSTSRINLPQANLGAIITLSPVAYEKRNTAALVITAASVSASPLILTHLAFWDNLTAGAGNLLTYGPLGASVTVNLGDPVSFNIDALTVRTL
jgi:hypothetical protein